MTTHHRKTISSGAALLLLGLATGLLWAKPAEAQTKRIKDTIARTDGKQIRGVEVLSMTVDKVIYKQRGSENVWTLLLPSDSVSSSVTGRRRYEGDRRISLRYFSARSSRTRIF